MTVTTNQTFPLASDLDLKGYGDLPKSGQFYNIDNDFQDSEIEALLTALAKKIQGTYVGAQWKLVREAISKVGNNGYKAHTSSLVVEFEGKPSFLIGSKASERRYGYIVLIEFTLLGKTPAPKFWFVQRLNCPDPKSYFPDPLPGSYPKPTGIPNTVFVEPFTANLDLRIESLSMHPLGLNKLALRRKLLEAYDVRAVTSSLGLNRTVAGAMKVVNDDSNLRTVLRPRNKRLQQSGGRCDLSELINWAGELCHQFDDASHATGLSSPFLSAFAESVNSIKGMAANACMLEVWILRDRANPRRHDQIEFFNDIKGSRVKLSSKEVETMLSAMEEILPLSTGTVVGSFVGSFAKNSFVSNLKIDVMTRTCKLHLQNCNIIVSERNGKSTIDTSLSKYINDSKLFRVTLDNGSVLFSSSGIHRDGDLKNSAALLLSIIRVNPKLCRAKTEKGDENLKASKFESTSVFSLIEKELAKNEEWVLCDDSSDEWADYVSLSTNGADGPVLRWYHAKLHRHYDSKTKKLLAVSASQAMRSATKLQEVVGQAVKNLGRVRLQQPDSDITSRVALWEKAYAWPDGDKLVSSMPRLRKYPNGVSGGAKARVNAFLKQCSASGSSPITRVEVSLVIPNYSKASLVKSFAKLGSKNASKTAPQVFWLLSGFMSNCIEANVAPVIYCRD